MFRSHRRARSLLALLGASCAAVPLVLQAAAPASAATTSSVVYDSFSKPGGYTLADYGAKWSNFYGLGEMALSDTRSFAGSRFNVSAPTFQTAYDYSVFDHLKYIGVSTTAFPVPTSGSVEISSTIRAVTPGTQPGRVIHGTYGPPGSYPDGAPWSAATLEGQQAGAVMNVIDFATGQLFDIFVAGHTAFALIERLPSNVTGNTTDTSSPDYVGTDKMYTQILGE
ncbi:MAG: DUF6081 family protein, partial [Mycobacteriales bacterium]